MLSGTGLKIKVVEALSYVIPIVCNILGIDGLLNKSKNGCLVTNSKTEFAQNISKLLYDDVLYKQIAQDAKTFFKNTLSEEVTNKHLDKSFDII